MRMLFANIDEIIDGSPEEKPMTNADRIRTMSDEELAKLLCSLRSCNNCRWGGWVCGLREWLKQPAEEVDHE